MLAKLTGLYITNPVELVLIKSASSQLTPTQISNVLGMKALIISDKSKIKRGKGKQAFAFN